MRRYLVIGLVILGISALLFLAIGAVQDQEQEELTLEAVYQRVVALEGQVDQLWDAIDDLGDDVEDRVDDLEWEIEELQDRVEDLEDELDCMND